MIVISSSSEVLHKKAILNFFSKAIGVIFSGPAEAGGGGGAVGGKATPPPPPFCNEVIFLTD